jgi:hypothetical protein
MLIQVRGVLVHVMSGTELSRVRTEFPLHLPEPINKIPLESRGPTLLCNQVDFPSFRLRDFSGLSGTNVYRSFGNRVDPSRKRHLLMSLKRTASVSFEPRAIAMNFPSGE